MALLDNSAQINTIMPKYVINHSLQVGPITDLVGSKVACAWGWAMPTQDHLAMS